MPVVSMPLEVRTASCSGRKSSPTTPTTRTLVKKLAARAKCVAAPPSTRSRLPLGVSRVSNATEPTTRMDKRAPYLVFAAGLQCAECGDLSTSLRFGRDDEVWDAWLPVFAVEQVELRFRLCGDGGAVGHDGELCGGLRGAGA